MDVEYIEPSELIPYSKNAKQHPTDQVKLIANSIKQFGFQQPIVIDKDNIRNVSRYLKNSKILSLRSVIIDFLHEM